VFSKTVLERGFNYRRLLGIGIRGNVEGILRQVIDIRQFSNIPVLSIDIPSGLDATQV